MIAVAVNSLETEPMLEIVPESKPRPLALSATPKPDDQSVPEASDTAMPSPAMPRALISLGM